MLLTLKPSIFQNPYYQRCQFYLQQNAQTYVPRKDLQAEVAEDIRTIFNAPDRTTADAYHAKTVEKYRKTASRLAECVVVNIPEGLTHTTEQFGKPTAHSEGFALTCWFLRIQKRLLFQPMKTFKKICRQLSTGEFEFSRHALKRAYEPDPQEWIEFRKRR